MVLGLTLAETLILLTFLLLLTTSAMTLHADRRASHLATELRHTEAVIAPIADELRLDGHRIANPRALVSLLERARREPALAAQLTRTEAMLRTAHSQLAAGTERNTALVTEIDRLRSAQRGSVTKAVQRDQMVAMLHRLPLAATAQDRSPVALLGAEIQQAASLRDANATLGGQNAQMRLAFLHQRGGSGLPYCWPTASGQPEYMLVLTIRDAGSAGASAVVVSDFTPRARPDAPEWTMLRNLPRNRKIATTEFIADTAALRALARDKKCLYAMEAIDRTGPTSKAAYKNFWGEVGPPQFHVHEIHGP